MQLNHRVLDAVNAVLDIDMPEEAYREAFNAQACLLAGLEAQDSWSYDVDYELVH